MCEIGKFDTDNELPICKSEFRPSTDHLADIAARGAQLLNDVDFDNYRPVIDDDAPDYVPISER